MATVEQIFAREYPLQHADFTYHNFLQSFVIGSAFIIWLLYKLATVGNSLSIWVIILLLLRLVIYLISIPIRWFLLKQVSEVRFSQLPLHRLRDRYVRIFDDRLSVYSNRITHVIIAFDVLCMLLNFLDLHEIFWTLTKYNIIKLIFARLYFYYYFPWADVNLTRIWNLWTQSGFTVDDLNRFSLLTSASEGGFEGMECSICMCEYEPQETVRQFWCKHHFHRNCIDEWMFAHRKCPYCQQHVDNPKRRAKTD